MFFPGDDVVSGDDELKSLIWDIFGICLKIDSYDPLVNLCITTENHHF